MMRRAAARDPYYCGSRLRCLWIRREVTGVGLVGCGSLARFGLRMAVGPVAVCVLEYINQ
jgi:hypothetical protein